MNLFSISRTVLYLSLLGTAAAAVIFLVKLLFRHRLGASWHYYIWLFMVVRLVLPYTPQFSFTVFELPAYSSPVEETGDGGFMNPGTAPVWPESGENTPVHIEDGKYAQEDKKPYDESPEEGKKENNRNSVNTYALIGTIWLCGVLAIVLYNLVLNTRLHIRMKRKVQIESGRINKILDACKKGMGINTGIELICSNAISAPCLCGFIKPKLVMPQTVVEELSDEEIRYIFLHELVHFKRKDILVNWIAIVVKALHWFNPVVWWAFRNMRQDCEVACDAAVLKEIRAVEHSLYGQTILNIARMLSNVRPVPGTTAIVSQSQTKRRIVMIKMFNQRPFIRRLSSVISVLAVTSVVLTAGCAIKDGGTGAENTGSSGQETNIGKGEEQKNIMKEFDSLLEKGTGIIDSIKFIDKNISQVSKENASKMVVALEQAQKENLPVIEQKYYDDSVQKKINKDFQAGFDMSRIDSIKDEELKALLVETRDSGYKVETAEGMFFPTIDYGCHSKYSTYVSPDIKAYIDIMAVESDKVPAKDAALVIDWDEIIKRAASQEQFIKNYGDSQKAGDIRNLLKKYLSFALYGLNNTPLFNYDSKTMNDEARMVYQKAISGGQDGKSLGIIRKFMEVLEKNSYTLTTAVEEFRKTTAELTEF